MSTPSRLQVQFDPARLAETCHRYGIRRLSVFGSVLRQDFTSSSDVDLLVEFEPDAVLGFRFLELESELSSIFGGRRVDLVREAYLNHRLRPHVLSSAEQLYAA
jgi:predicted nucleotidyltransferase